MPISTTPLMLAVTSSGAGLSNGIKRREHEFGAKLPPAAVGAKPMLALADW
ncbi:hypothetical protein [Variovorax sp.]|jgi:hypothetical protein|uniref:hypothetical protein n=1 Tax=Variovorax sp. TaxID=1871043 RepID=UPI0037D9EB5D